MRAARHCGSSHCDFTPARVEMPRGPALASHATGRACSTDRVQCEGEPAEPRERKSVGQQRVRMSVQQSRLGVCGCPTAQPRPPVCMRLRSRQATRTAPRSGAGRSGCESGPEWNARTEGAEMENKQARAEQVTRIGGRSVHMDAVRECRMSSGGIVGAVQLQEQIIVHVYTVAWYFHVWRGGRRQSSVRPTLLVS